MRFGASFTPRRRTSRRQKPPQKALAISGRGRRLTTTNLSCRGRLAGATLGTLSPLWTMFRDRLANRVQLTTDGHSAYLGAVEEAFGADIDFAQLVKL